MCGEFKGPVTRKMFTFDDVIIELGPYFFSENIDTQAGVIYISTCGTKGPGQLISTYSICVM